MFEAALHFYDWTLRKVLRRKFATLLVSFAVIALTVFLYEQVPRPDLFPTKTRDWLFGFVQAPEGISFDQMGTGQSQQIANHRGADPERDVHHDLLRQSGESGRVSSFT